jgi:hypothetical protein
MKRFMFLVMLILAFFLVSSVAAGELGDDNLTDTGGFDEIEFQNHTFEDLSQKISDTPENQTLTLTDDYRYSGGDIHGIVISKPITIDGAGHTIDANHSSRIFNITADNVVLRNINFVNGNALGRYFDSNVGGGAIYWTGANGHISDCNFTANTGSGIEDDPFDKEETVVTEDGMIIHTIRMRPMGARINQGGAITWRGDNGTVTGCIFKDNHVGYPDGGGAICWRGNDGKITDSIFLNNGAWVGSAVEWRGANGLISSSKFSNFGLSDNGIFWSGANGTLINSILLSNDGRRVVNGYSPDLNADFNYWGDDISNPNQFIKPDNVSYWYVSRNLNVSFDNLKINDSFILIKTIAPDTAKIVSKNLKVYYTSATKFKIQVFDKRGNADGYSDVTFYINGHEYYEIADDDGYATLKLKLKPGKYTIFSQYGDIIVKNKITVKTSLITKDISKKAKKSAKFKVKVLNSKGKAFKKQLVKIKFKGKTYKLKTNKNGIATFKVPKNLKVGKHKIKTTYKGLTNTNKIIVKK